MAGIRWGQQRMRITDATAEGLHVPSMGVDELTAERASLAAGAEQTKADCIRLANRIRKLEVAAKTHEEELRIVVSAVLSLGE